MVEEPVAAALDLLMFLLMCNSVLLGMASGGNVSLIAKSARHGVLCVWH